VCVGWYRLVSTGGLRSKGDGTKLVESLFDKQRLLEGAIQMWRKSLVSFDGNNRQIYYRRKKVGDVPLSDPLLSQEVLEVLLSGGKVRASALYPKIYSRLGDVVQVDTLAGVDQAGLEHVEDEQAQSEDALIETSNGDPAHEWAQRLRRYEAVFRKTKEDFEEKNVDTCFVAEGFATWQPKQSGTTLPNAPLLLHPIRIESRSRGNSDFELEKYGDTVLNEALCLYLETEYGLPKDIFNIQGEDLRLDSLAIKDLITAITEMVPAFQVLDEMLLGNFTFSHYPMVVDLQRIIDKGSTHPLLSALAGLESAIREVAESGSEEELEDLAVKSPILENLVFPADSSQHSAISAIMGGKSVVIQGPPGTGKSQTIANVIAECAANRKSVLFVAEKRAAIDAVVERLADRGLQGIVLDLHGEPDKKTIAKNLTEVFKTFQIPPALSSNDQEKLLRAKLLLQKRWKWMHQETGVADFEGSEMTLAELFRQVGVRSGEIDREVVQGGLNYLGQLDRITASVREEIADKIDLLYRCHFFDGERKNSFAAQISRFIRTSSDAQELVQTLSQLKSIASTREFQKAASVARQLIPDTDENFDSVLKIFTSFIDIQKAATEWDVDRYEEVIALIPAFGPLRAYGKLHGQSFISAYFARRRDRTTYSKLRKDGRQDLSESELLNSLASFQKVIKTWMALGGNIISLESSVDVAGYFNVLSHAAPLIDRLDAFGTEWRFAELSSQAIAERLAVLNRDLQYFRDLPLLNEALDMLKGYSLQGVIELFQEEGIDSTQARLYWEYLWFAGKLQQHLAITGESAFHSTSLNSAVSQFRVHDQEAFRSAPGKIIRSITSTQLDAISPGHQLLRRESFKKSGHLPFRELLIQIPTEIMSIKPCFAMSPLNVSKMLPNVEGLFDVVIFDEASQIRPQHAITSIYRGKQIVVAGDRHQLPPTSVGLANVALVPSTEAEEAATFNLQTTEMESILDAFAATLPGRSDHIKPLKLHYRSNDERLISWSNFHIYRESGEELASFPSVTTEATGVLKYSYLPNVKTQSMNQPNEPEIAHVLELVKEHVRSRPNESLGVIAFGSRHALRLQDAFNILEKQDGTFYRWKAEWNSQREKFFVKNIERVQGDERDAIIITPGYAPNLQGDVLLQFGSLNNAGGERRLNVAASRAKRSLHLVTSLRSTDIDLGRSKARSVALFRSFLNFMENEGRLEELSKGYAVPQSPFEEEIFEALTETGLQVDCQVGNSRYKIDFAIRHPETNQYLLAIEADGWTYHSSPYARERDWLRQDVLERKGWQFVRIWSTDWWENPQREVDRVLAAYEQVLRRPDLSQQAKELPFGRDCVEAVSESNSEYAVLKGLLAQFPNLEHEEALSKWMSILGLQRRTKETMQRFSDYWIRIHKK